jgi:hypothetical protein
VFRCFQCEHVWRVRVEPAFRTGDEAINKHEAHV